MGSDSEMRFACHVCGEPATHIWGTETRCAVHPLKPRRIPGTINRQYPKLTDTEQPRQQCRHCGTWFHRTRSPSGALESRPRFARRQYCSRSCRSQHVAIRYSSDYMAILARRGGKAGGRGRTKAP